MRIVALLALRNETPYLHRCLAHLAAQGVETYVIDNGSHDGSRNIAESFLGQGVIAVEDYPYPGFYDWSGLLRRKEELAESLGADWYIHCDADEIREAPAPFATLAEGIAAIDATGCNAIDFDEFVFVPTSPDDAFERTDYVALMRHYYYFKPRPLHRLTAWKNPGVRVDLVSEAGHRVTFPGLKVSTTRFVLRHYIALSHSHFVRKYTTARTYSKREVDELGWHGWRAAFTPASLRLPQTCELKLVSPGGWDRSDPRSSHRFLAD